MFRKLFFIWTSVLLTLLLLSGISLASMATQHPNNNWGNTSGLDAILPPPGMYLSNYIIDYSANDLLDDDGHEVQLPGGDDPDLDVVAYAPQFIYVGEKIWGDWTPGFIVFPTIISSWNVDSDFLSADSSTIGDLIFGPWIGHTEKLSENCLFHWTFEFDTYFPTGEYDEHKDLNPSYNAWTFEPWMDLALQLPYGITLGTRQHFTYNTENNDTDIRGGACYHFNYSIWKTLDFINPKYGKFDLGVVGYYWKQLEEDELDDHDIDDSEYQTFSYGPALSWVTPTHQVIRLKWYHETEVENGFEGDRMVLRIIQKLW